MVADTLRDLQAAQAAGCEPHLVCTGRAAGLDAAQVRQMVAQVPGTQVHTDLAAFAEFVLSHAVPGHAAAAPVVVAAAARPPAAA